MKATVKTAANKTAELVRGQKTKMIQKLLKAGKTIGEVRKALEKKGITVYDSEVRRLANA